MSRSDTFTHYRIEIKAEDLEKLARRVEADPENVELLDWAAFAFYSNGMLEEAIRCYRELVKRSPANPSYHYYLGSALYKNGLHGAARVEWEKVLHLDGEGKFVKRCQRKLAQLEEHPKT